MLYDLRKILLYKNNKLKCIVFNEYFTLNKLMEYLFFNISAKCLQLFKKKKKKYVHFSSSDEEWCNADTGRRSIVPYNAFGTRGVNSN